MEADEQMMLQLWFANMRDKLVAGETEFVINELNTALGQIDDDQRGVDSSHAEGPRHGNLPVEPAPRSQIKETTQ